MIQTNQPKLTKVFGTGCGLGKLASPLKCGVERPIQGFVDELAVVGGSRSYPNSLIGRLKTFSRLHGYRNLKVATYSVLTRYRKRAVAVILALVIFAAAVAVYQFWPKPNKVEPVEVYGFIELPSPETKGVMSVEEAILRRRSIRSYTDEPLSLQEVSQLV